MQKLLASFALFSLIFAALPSPQAQASTSVQFGDLIRGETFSAVYYYGEDGFRYVFPNEKTYFTWYSDFSSVTTVSDTELGSIQIGGNVTYKPGVKLVKIQSDPKTYAVGRNGGLHWVSSEEVAEAMLGSNWNTLVDDIPDSFFSNYTVSYSLDTPEEAQNFQMQYLSHERNTISDDKNLTYYTDFYLEGGLPGYEGENTISIFDGETVLFTNFHLASADHTATADDGSWGTGTLHAGETFVRRFDEPGTYTFHCSYHPEMTGTIEVMDGIVID